MKKLLLFPFLLVLYSGCAYNPKRTDSISFKTTPTAQVKLAWDSPTGANPTNYNIYYGTVNGTYPNKVPTGLVNIYTLTGLSLSTKYYIVATALYDTQESGYSNQIIYQVPSVLPPPVTTGIKEVP